MAQPFDPMRERLNRKPLNEKRLMSGPYWAELRIFLAVAKSRSFNRAAKTLGISQPTVSRHVHWLQDIMGSQLLVASQHGVILTDRGKELADLLISLDEKLFSISQSLGSESKEAAGVVRFSSTEAIAGLFIVPKLREFGGQHPNITLHVRNITNMLDFRENQSDIVLGFAPSEQDGIESRPVGVMHLIPYASNAYIEKHGVPSQTNLENHKFIDAEYYSSRTDIWKSWQAALKRGKVAHLCDNSFAYCLAVKEGLGIGLLGNYVLPDQELIPADIDVHVALRMYLLADSERLKSRPVRIVYNWLSTILGENNQWLAARPKITGEWSKSFGQILSRSLLENWPKQGHRPRKPKSGPSSSRA
jgi:DNA-binding transcriptional LysR family regulator